MWPFFSCLAAKTFVQPLTSSLIMTAGTALSSGINKCSLAPLTHLSRIRMQRSLSQPTAVSVSPLRILPSGGTLSLALQTYVAYICFRGPSSPTLSLICHSAWKGWFSPSLGPWCQSSLAHFCHLPTSYPCVYPILFLMLSNIYKAMSSYSLKMLPKSNSSLWCLQNPWQLLLCPWSLTLTHIISLFPYIPVSLIHFLLYT